MNKKITLAIFSLISFNLFSQNLTQTPPMGWNSWDCLGYHVVESQVKATADYMSDNLISHGWEYVVIDMGWYLAQSMTSNDGQLKNPPQSIDEWGRLNPHTIKFPSAKGNNGMKPLADYIHGKDLKFGIHIMRGLTYQAIAGNTPIKNSTAKAAEVANLSDTCILSGIDNSLLFY